MTYNNTEDKKYKLDEALYGAADASGNNNDGAALSLGSNETYRNPALDKYGFEF